MPFKLKKMPKRFHCIKLICSLLILALFFCFTLYHTSKRISPTQISDSNDPPHYSSSKKDTNRQIDSPKILSRNDKSTILSEKDDIEKEIWCEVRDYIDLSEKPVFREFSRWLETHLQLNCQKTGNCTDHDPRLIANHLSYGEKLARTRAKVLSKVIRGDPRKALELAVTPEVINLLPEQVSTHLESWEMEIVAISAIHSCFNEEHSGGFIKRRAQFSDGRFFRTWAYGKYRKLPSVSNLPIVGISLGQDLAISEEPFLVSEKSIDNGVIQMAGQSFAYSNSMERTQAIEKSRRRVGEIAKTDHPKIKGKKKSPFFKGQFSEGTTHFYSLYLKTRPY